MHRPGDVLQLLLAKVAESEVKLTGGVLRTRSETHTPPNSASASRRAAMLTHSPKMSPYLEDNVALMDADAVLDAIVSVDRGVDATQMRLHLVSAPQRIHGAAEFDQEAVAGGFDDAPVMGCNAGSTISARIALSRSSVPCSSWPISRE